MVVVSVVFLAEWTHGPTREEHHPLHLPVEEEVVEVPDGAVLPEWIRREVRIVGEEFTVHQFNFCVQSVPKFVVNLSVFCRGGDRQKIVNVARNKLKYLSVKTIL